MEHRLVLRVLLTLLCVVQGVMTVVMDLNRTHATHPGWMRHARFHVVWQTLTMVLLAVVEVGLLWGGVVDRERGFYGALVLAMLSPVAFLLAWMGRRRFDGALWDPGGISPLRVTVLGRERVVEMNMVAVLVAVTAMVVMGVLY